MRRIAHLSDLHFGRHDDRVVAGLSSALTALRPDVVVISGDFTQRARRRQFAAARDFLDGLRAAGLQIVAVPGNHDVPLYDIVRRFLRPLARFRRYIEPAEYPFVADDEMAVLGINTARSLTIADGRVSREQMTCIEEIFARAAPHARRMLVTHHPLVPLPGGAEGHALRAAGRSGDAIEAAVRANVHLLLAGHHHQPFSGSGAAFFAAGHSLLVVQAGTTTSTRLRAHVNSFNLIESDGDALRIAIHGWDGDSFEPVSFEAYRCVGGRWEDV